MVKTTIIILGARRRVGFRADIFQEMMKDPKESKRLDKAKTLDDIAKIVEDYCRSHGKKTKDVLVP